MAQGVLRHLKNRLEHAFSANGITSFGYIWDEGELNKLANQPMPYYGLMLQNANIEDVENTSGQFINYQVVLLLADNLHQADQTVTAVNRWDYWWSKMNGFETLTFSLLDNVSDYPETQVTGAMEMRHIPYSSQFNLCALYVTFNVTVQTDFCVHDD
jgi:hypothetical protein